MEFMKHIKREAILFHKQWPQFVSFDFWGVAPITFFTSVFRDGSERHRNRFFLFSTKKNRKKKNVAQFSSALVKLTITRNFFSRFVFVENFSSTFSFFLFNDFPFVQRKKTAAFFCLCCERKCSVSCSFLS